jgi:hypothetical protein
MKTYLSQTVLRAVQRLADAPEHTLSLVAARFGTEFQLEPAANEAPDHVMMRLERTFDALSELPFQPDVTDRAPDRERGVERLFEAAVIIPAGIGDAFR